MKNNPIILFDGVCNLCNSSVQFVLKHEKNQVIKFASLQSDFGQEILKMQKLDAKLFDSIVFIENDIVYTKSTAVLRIAKYLKKPYFFLSYLHIIPVFLRNLVYDFVAKNRYKLYGKSETCWLPSPEWSNRFIG